MRRRRHIQTHAHKQQTHEHVCAHAQMQTCMYTTTPISTTRKQKTYRKKPYKREEGGRSDAAGERDTHTHTHAYMKD